jgi:glycosyltransferase involved in cell wall biosynthesis
MVVTDVGGLKGTIGARGTGIVAPEASAPAIRKEILRYFEDPSLQESCHAAILQEKKRLGWDAFSEALSDFAATL